jgi:hypothetical protein
MRNKLLFYIANIDYYFHKFFPKKAKKVRNYYSLDRSLFKVKFAILKIVNNIFNLNLSELFYICGSDKHKHYKNIYDFLTTNFKREDKINILEVGIGSHNFSGSGGGSLIALSLYYKKAKIYGIDLFDKSFLNIRNIQTIVGDQSSKKNLEFICNQIPDLDIVIDDGSHFVDHQFNTFNIFYKNLRNGGIYIIEDIVGSYRVRNNGDPDLGIDKNIVSYFQKYIHSVNYLHLKREHQKKFLILKDLNSISFFQDCIVIQRKNKEFKSVNEKDIYLTLDAFNKKYSKNKKREGYIETS